MVNRRGATTMGCLFTAALIVAAGYAGIQVGEPYYRFYKFKDAMEQEARFATLRSDSLIRNRLLATADSLGLPEDAYHFKIIRLRGAVHITVSYDDQYKIGPFVRPVAFDADVEDSL